MKKLLVILLFPLSSFATGGNGSGGGNAVVCFKNADSAQRVRLNKIVFDDLIDDITLVEAYDLYEARRVSDDGKPSAQIYPVRDAKNYRDYAEAITDRYEKDFPAMAVVIRNGVNNLTDIKITGALHYFDDTRRIDEISDSHCAIAMMAVQEDVENSEPLRTTLRIDGRLFNHPKHSDLSRGVLYLHESIYYIARTALEQADSRDTRELLAQAIQLHGVTALGIMKTFLDNGFGKLRMRLDQGDGHKIDGERWAYVSTLVPGYRKFENEISKKLTEKTLELFKNAIASDRSEIKNYENTFVSTVKKFGWTQGENRFCTHVVHDSSAILDTPFARTVSCWFQAHTYSELHGDQRPYPSADTVELSAADTQTFRNYENLFNQDLLPVGDLVRAQLKEYFQTELLPGLGNDSALKAAAAKAFAFFDDKIKTVWPMKDPDYLRVGDYGRYDDAFLAVVLLKDRSEQFIYAIDDYIPYNIPIK